MSVSTRVIGRLIAPIFALGVLLTCPHPAVASSARTTSGCNAWHPLVLTLAGYGTAATFCSSLFGRSIVVTNISHGVVRVYPSETTSLEVRPDGSAYSVMMDDVLGDACSQAPRYCDIRPGRRLLATDPSLVHVGVEIPTAESFDANLVWELGSVIQGLATPRPLRFVNSISDCIDNVTGTFDADTQEEQITQAIQGTTQCRSTLQKIRDAANGDELLLDELKPINIAESVMNERWLEASAFDVSRALRWLKR